MIILVVYDLKSVGPLEFKLVAPMPEQPLRVYGLKPEVWGRLRLREMHCWGPNLFWDGCNETQILGH